MSLSFLPLPVSSVIKERIIFSSSYEGGHPSQKLSLIFCFGLFCLCFQPMRAQASFPGRHLHHHHTPPLTLTFSAPSPISYCRPHLPLRFNPSSPRPSPACSFLIRLHDSRVLTQSLHFPSVVRPSNVLNSSFFHFHRPGRARETASLPIEQRGHSRAAAVRERFMPAHHRTRLPPILWRARGALDTCIHGGVAASLCLSHLCTLEALVAGKGSRLAEFSVVHLHSSVPENEKPVHIHYQFQSLVGGGRSMQSHLATFIIGSISCCIFPPRLKRLPCLLLLPAAGN